MFSPKTHSNNKPNITKLTFWCTYKRIDRTSSLNVWPKSENIKSHIIYNMSHKSKFILFFITHLSHRIPFSWGHGKHRYVYNTHIHIYIKENSINPLQVNGRCGHKSIPSFQNCSEHMASKNIYSYTIYNVKTSI